MCPSYWVADAFSGNGRVAYHYQYSVIGAQHGSDVPSYLGPATPNQGSDFNKAFRTIWGNFITQNNPSISASIANGLSTPSNTLGNAATNFPPWSLAQPLQLNLNQTGGTAFSALSFSPTRPNITEFENPGLMNAFEIVNAYTWEGGRGVRCDFWRSVAAIVPE